MVLLCYNLVYILLVIRISKCLYDRDLARVWGPVDYGCMEEF